MDFEWDDRKAASNIAKHGVSFEAAKAALADPNRIEISQRVNGEDRWKVICALDMTVYVVIHSEPVDGPPRIISAREAERHEEKVYYRRSSGGR